MKTGAPGALSWSVPAVFVLLWATGFIGARYGMPHAEPFAFLAWRFALVTAIFVAIALATGAAWPTRRQALHSGVVGIMLHGFYLGGVFAAISRGMPVGLSALIVGLQPVLTAILARPLLGERLGVRQWLGIVLGFGGLVLVLWHKSGVAGPAGWAWDTPAVAYSIAALCGITAANFYQKKFGGAQDLRTGAIFQYAAAFIAVAALSWVFETGRVAWTPDFIFAMAWLVLVMSVGAVTLLMVIIRNGEVSRISGLFYLVPPVTAILGYLLFGDRMTGIGMIGIAITAAGVMLVMRKAA